LGKGAKMNAVKINLESFMTEAFQESGMTFDAFHGSFGIANKRRGNTLYTEIKNGELSVSQLVNLLRMFGA
jgi:hypothetical protein